MQKNNFAFDLGTEAIRVYKDGIKIAQFSSFDEGINSFLTNGGKIILFNQLEDKVRNVIRKYDQVFLGFLRMSKNSGLMMVPANCGEVELRAYRDLLDFTALVYPSHMVYDHFVASAGLGINKSGTYMIVDSGAGKTRMTTIQKGDFLEGRISTVTDMAGNSMNEAITFGLSHEYGLQISRFTAEELKKEVCSLAEDAPIRQIVVKGTDKTTRDPKEVTVSGSELNNWLLEEVKHIKHKIAQHYYLLPPEMQQEISKTGIHLVGRNFRLPGFVQLIARDLPVSSHSYQLSRDYMEEGLIYVQQHQEEYMPYFLK
ncbi:MAG: rod shape-determining protein [Tannerellaceae bacterium]|nr:rod shape-determining protein [Tannerellaceae bacterium]